MTVQTQSDMKTHILTIFKTQIFSVVPNAEGMDDNSLSESLLELQDLEILFAKESKIILHIKCIV